jgi:multidrug resistance efflux pump
MDRHVMTAADEDRRFLVSTDDAYLQADSVIISPRVAGFIPVVLVEGD